MCVSVIQRESAACVFSQKLEVHRGDCQPTEEDEQRQDQQDDVQANVRVFVPTGMEACDREHNDGQATVSHEAMPVRAGTIRPIAPSISAMPMKRSSTAGRDVIQAIYPSSVVAGRKALMNPATRKTRARTPLENP